MKQRMLWLESENKELSPSELRRRAKLTEQRVDKAIEDLTSMSDLMKVICRSD